MTFLLRLPLPIFDCYPVVEESRDLVAYQSLILLQP
jgi:hypothetical protein